MRALLDSGRMARLDRYTIEEVGLPGAVLMENAGRGVFDLMVERFAGHLAHGPTVVVCGTGNNGGDGFVIARYLLNSGFRARVLLCGDEAKVGGDARIHLDAFTRSGGKVKEIGEDEEVEAVGIIASGVLVVDALFGTGLQREITGFYAGLVEAIDLAPAPVVAVDLPSGIDADTGAILGVAPRAELTVTFGFAKKGHYLLPGHSCCGEVATVDIGIPAGAEARQTPDMYLICAEDYTGSFLRATEAHKGHFGHLLVIAGGRGKMGAAALAAMAALRSGAGLVTLAFPAGLMEEARLPMEVMTATLGEGKEWSCEVIEELLALLDGVDAVAMGPGIGTEEGAEKVILAVVAEAVKTDNVLPCVLDADALTILAKQGEWSELLGEEMVITPHPGEAARLLGVDNSEVQTDRVAAALRLSQGWPGVAVLKGAGTLVSDAAGVKLVEGGNPGMATAGSGDVLTGITGAFLARAIPASAAAFAASAIHAAAGDLAAQEVGMEGMTAGDILERVATVLKGLEE